MLFQMQQHIRKKENVRGFHHRRGVLAVSCSTSTVDFLA